MNGGGQCARMASMSMSRRARERQESLWIPTTELPVAPGNPFYTKLNELLSEADFDLKVEALCEPFYAAKKGRPSIAPGVYMRMLMVGYFEGARLGTRDRLALCRLSFAEGVPRVPARGGDAGSLQPQPNSHPT